MKVFSVNCLVIFIVIVMKIKTFILKIFKVHISHFIFSYHFRTNYYFDNFILTNKPNIHLLQDTLLKT